MASFTDYSILLVDDNVANRLIAATLLARRHENKPDTANDGLEALEALRKKRYDLVFMDCMMPEMDGYQATKALRNGEAGELNKTVPVVALTANAMSTDEKECLEAGMSDYLSKPIRPAELEKKLMRWCGMRDGE